MAIANTKTIKELCDQKLTFFIPAYQRGYRWTVTQMKELIVDLYSFLNSNTKECYCVQPIIVKENGDDQHWIVVDGQQRLTAIWLIMAIGSCFDNSQNWYELNYEKKKDLELLMNKIKRDIWGKADFQGQTDTLVASIVDDFMDKSIDCLNIVENLKWIAGNRDTKEESIVNGKNINHFLYLPKIMDSLNRIEVIWYELEDKKEDNAIETFANINANKIRLTNSELLKAMLLNQVSNEEKEMQSMAYTWEQLEKGLHNDSFWNFMMNNRQVVKKNRRKKTQYSTRLDYLFEIWCVSHEGDGINIKPDDNYSIFHEIDGYLKKQSDSKKETKNIWREIQEIYEALLDWYGNYDWYHMIGTLIALNDQGVQDADAKLIHNLFVKYNSSNKQEFRMDLIGRLTRHYFECTGNNVIKVNSLKDTKIEDIKNDLKKVNYGSNSVITILLLYNIALLINAKNEYERFPFDLYNSQYWELEHVNPQTPLEMGTEEKKAWADSYKKFFEKIKENALHDAINGLDNTSLAGKKKQVDNIIKELDEFIKSLGGDEKTAEDKLASVSQHIENILSISGDIDDNNNIQNLVLLDRITNRSYKNACFSDKRAEIISIERNMRHDEKNILEGEKVGSHKRFVLLGTKWVFLKGFAESRELLVWGKTDMEEYKKDIAKNIIKMLGGNVDESADE